MSRGSGNPPLDELRVLEISDRIAGGYCGKLLADAGAEVRKIEPPQGDSLRRWSATGSPVPPPGDSPLFSYLNAGKRSVTCPADSDRLRAELSAADVVVVTAGPSRAAALGVDPQRLLADCPRAVVVTISDFGWTGPYVDRAASEFTLQAWAGSPGFRGDPAGPPIAIGGDLGEYMGGVFAAFGTLAVLRRVEQGGPGEHLDLSMLEAITWMQSSEWLHSQLLKVPPIRRTLEVPSIEPAKDGYVGITMVTGQQWLDFAAMVECPQFTEIEQLQFQIGRWAYRDFIREQIGPWMAERTVEEIVELGQLFRLPIAALGNGSTIRDMDYVTQRGVFVRNPAGFHQPRPPWLMSRSAPAPVGDTASAGADNDESPWRKREHDNPAAPGLPLRGVRIVDLTAFWAGPAATHVLAAFGADVVKVESIQRPDGIRYSGGMRKDVDDWWEYGWVFHAMNTNKRSVTLDLNSDDGRRLFKALVAGADVMIENFSPRVMDNFALTADVLLQQNPKLVVARMPAFGLDGPWRERVGFAPTMEQLAGLAWVTGLPENPPVTPRGACDPLAGVHAAFAVLAALQFADRTGTGQQVELPMIETVLNVTAIQPIEHEVFGVTLTRRGNRGHGQAIQNIYRCAGPDDDWIAITVQDDQQWRALVELMGRPSWCDAGLSTVVARHERADEIDERLRDWFAGQPLESTVQRLAAVGVPVAPVVSPSLVTENPQLRDRGFFEQLVHPSTGPGLYPCPPFARLAGQDRWLHRPPPRLGEHNDEVLCDRCGLSGEELARLAADEVIGTRPKGA
ncbi:acyl-CoA transferase [Mycobacterium sp. 1164966.3]|uniref:CaiB/BaiF CoA transferase family protein n=1 Tax=Mycobacterium sp. 1164966.3 TaxID=1856861 RepID=UPI0008020A22|nr:acyl-CoA transferase [Mycobacterium sp. 1164966.3]